MRRKTIHCFSYLVTILFLVSCVEVVTLPHTPSGTTPVNSVSTSLPFAAITTATFTPTSSPVPHPTPTPTPTPFPSPVSVITATPSPSPLATVTATTSVVLDNEITTRIFTPVATLFLPPTPALEETGATPGPTLPVTRSLRIGLHGRNDLDFQEADYQLVREAGIETLKMLSLTRPEVFARLKQDNPRLDFIVRLYDDRINAEGHPSPQEFADRMIPVLQGLQPYAVKFEVGNEPNHFQRYEGWGPEDADAEDFNRWFLEVYDLLKAAHPWAQLGFPALGTPDQVHRDRAWLELNRQAIERADWLGVHCYWQTYPDGSTTMFDLEHGLCFTYYHELFPDKPLELTEFDNDNVIWEIPALSEEALAAELATYYQELYHYPYLRSASSFIISSPDPRWDYFTWRDDSGRFKPVVTTVATMPRPSLAE